jgi:hypothetical protein
LASGWGCISINLELILGSNDDDEEEGKKYVRCEFSKRLSTLLTPVNSWNVEEEDDYDMERWTPSSKIANRPGLVHSDGMNWLASSLILNGLPPLLEQYINAIDNKLNPAPLMGIIASNTTEP